MQTQMRDHPDDDGWTCTNCRGIYKSWQRWGKMPLLPSTPRLGDRHFSQTYKVGNFSDFSDSQQPPPQPRNYPEDDFRCFTCGPTQWYGNGQGAYSCARCGGFQHYNTKHPQKLQDVARGTWLYMASYKPKTPSKMGKMGSRQGYEENFGSETATTDPLVDPSEGRPKRRGGKRGGGGDGGEPEGDDSHQGGPGKGRRRKGGSQASWNSKMGPSKGLRWRGGAPPAPPAWNYDKHDLRAFSKWEKPAPSVVSQYEQTTRPAAQSGHHGSGKGSSSKGGYQHRAHGGKGYNHRQPRHVHAAETEVAEDGSDEGEEDAENDEYGEDGYEEDYDDEDEDEESDLLQVLTVTATKLAGLTPGRKYTDYKPGTGGRGGKGKSSKGRNKTPADRKATSRCADCGEIGHWQGDAECKGPTSEKSGGKKGLKGSGKAPKKVHVAEQYDGADYDESQPYTVSVVARHHSGLQTQHDMSTLTHEVNAVKTPSIDIAGQASSSSSVSQSDNSFFVWTVTSVPYNVPVRLNEVHLSNVEQAAGYMVIDTACQRIYVSRSRTEICS
jgi:hypothetical protein